MFDGMSGANIPAHTIVGTGQNAPLATSTFGMVGQTDNSNSSTNQRVFEVGLPGLLDGLTAFTLAYWVYVPTVISGSWWGQSDASASSFCETNGSTTGPYLRNVIDLRGSFTEIGTVGEWQHLAWIYSPAGISYARNGVTAQTLGSPSGSIGNAATNGFYIGGQQAGSGAESRALTSGLFADFRCYNVALTPDALWSLYDPATRWDLYWVPSRRVFFDVGGAVATGKPYLYYAAQRQQAI